MSFGKRLKALRIEHNMTQDALAKKIKLSKANVSKYEADLVEPNLNTLAIVSALFDVSIDYLIGVCDTYPDKELVDSCSDLNEDELKKVLEYIEFLKTFRKD